MLQNLFSKANKFARVDPKSVSCLTKSNARNSLGVQYSPQLL